MRGNELRRWHKMQERQRRRALKEYTQHQFRANAAAVESRIRSKYGDTYDDKPLIDRVLGFRSAVFRFIFFSAFFMFINIATRGNFPWFLFPSAFFLFDALRKGGSIWSDGIGPFEAFKKGIRVQLLATESPMRRPYEDATSRRLSAPATSAPPASSASARRAERFRPPPPDRALSAVPPDVMGGAHGAAVRRAMDDSSVVRDALNRLGPLEKEMLPDVSPTVDALTDRVASLAMTLHRLDMDVSGATLGTLDERIGQLKTDVDSPDRTRRLSLLERQRTSLHDLLSRRQALLTQLESAGLALQNLKLDLLKLRSAGMEAAMEGGPSATQEARSVSRDIGHIIEVADDLRNI
jgi:hypothetical protein